MKILQLTNKPPFPDKDGGSIAALSLTKGLAMDGHQVTVLSMSTLKHPLKPGDIPEELRRLATFHLVDVPAAISKPAALLNLLFSSRPYHVDRFSSPEFASVLTRLLKEETFDVVQLEGLYLCPYIPVIRKNSKARIAYRAHNLEHELWQRSSGHASGFRKWYLRNLAARIRRYETGCLNQYDLLIPITERDESMLNRLGNRKPSFVVPAGINFSRMSPGTSPCEALTLFHLGSLEWYPNQEGLLWFVDNCWSLLRGRIPGIRFSVAGRGAPDWLIQRLRREGVIFDGEVDDAYAYMNSKAVMVVPLLSGSGMRVKIIEGMALGKAIVSTTLGAEGLGVVHGRNILIADQPMEFAGQIEYLFNHPDRLIELGEEAKALIRVKFDSRLVARRLAQFYLNNLT